MGCNPGEVGECDCCDVNDEWRTSVPGIETGSDPLFENCPNIILLVLSPLPPVLPPKEDPTEALSGKSKSKVLSTFAMASSKALSSADSSGSAPGWNNGADIDMPFEGVRGSDPCEDWDNWPKKC